MPRKNTTFFNLPPKRLKFGNRAMFSALLEEFSDQSTLHGARYILGWKTPCWKTWLWRIFFAFCLFAVISGTRQLVESFIDEPLSVTESAKLYDVGPEMDDLFPNKVRITICQLPPWDNQNHNETFLLKYGFAALGYPFFSLSGAEYSYMFYNTSADDIKELSDIATSWDNARKKYQEGNIKGDYVNTFIENRSPDCADMFPDHVRTCRDFTPVLTTLGKCYTELYLGPTPGVLHFFSAPHEDLLEPEGHAIIATHPMARVEFVNRNAAIILPPGFSMTLRITLKMINRDALYTSWYAYEPNCPLLPGWFEPNQTRRHIYSEISCQDRWKRNFMEKHANCSSILSAKKRNRRICSPDDMINGFKKWIRSPNYQKHAEERRKACREPCKEYEYDLEWTMTKLGGKNISQLIYRYDNKVFYLKEFRKNSIPNVLSQIGGFLGLYLGASIITIVEVIGFLVLCVWYKVGPRKTHRILEKTAVFQQGQEKLHCWGYR